MGGHASSNRQIDLAADYFDKKNEVYDLDELFRIDNFFKKSAFEVSSYSESGIDMGDTVKQNIRTVVYSVPDTGITVYRATVIIYFAHKRSDEFLDNHVVIGDCLGNCESINDYMTIASDGGDESELESFTKRLFSSIDI
ncbi:hypothetical protein HQ545_04960 [Candidatus Woesearchaeota archaeon]|nr:hypothetical protein [Candidatus Woesearchaeota archaeon]